MLDSMSISSPISFARGLADPLQPNRLKALAGLNAWMEESGAEYDFTSVEIDQLWHALHYTMWMADKRPVQQQVAAESILLVRKIKPELVTEWNRGFWMNLDRIYETIDKYRIPKFHLFIRIYVSEMFHQMHLRSWEAGFVAACIKGIVSNLEKSAGAYIQLLSVFVPELEATVGDNFRGVISKASTFRMLLKPALTVVKRGQQVPLSLVSKAISEVLTNDKVVKYSIKTREWMKSEMQTVAMDKETSQEVRELLFAALEGMDGAVVKISKKSRVEL